MLLTVFLAIVFCTAISLMLLSAVALNFLMKKPIYQKHMNILITFPATVK